MNMSIHKTIEPELAKPESVGISGERLNRISEAMQRNIDSGRITGAVTAVARRGKVVHFEAHGMRDLEAGVPMEKNAIFRMASSTKPVTGVAVLMMMEEGRLRLTDPVYRYLPEFRGARVRVLKSGADPKAEDAYDIVPADREITIKHLMTHTTGLNGEGLPNPGPGDTLENFTPKIAENPLDFHPGTRWRYTGGPRFSVLSRIVEVVSGEPFDEFAQKRIFGPLGMVDTYFVLPEDKRSRLLPLYRRSEGEWRRVEGANHAGPEVTYIAGSGGLVSTAHDYLRWEQMLANGGELDGVRLLSPITVDLMCANHVGDLYRGLQGNLDGVGFGLTVYIVLDPATSNIRRPKGAIGWAGAFGTISWSDRKEGLAVVLMIQQRDQRVQAEFENAVMQAIID